MRASLTIANAVSRINSLCARLRQDTRGISAVEFGLVVPFIVVLMLGGYELTKGVNLDRKITLVARTLADLTTQESSITSFTNILNAGKTVAAPFDENLIKVILSNVNVDNSGNAKIGWSVSSGGATARTVNAVAPIPASMLVPNTSIVWAEVSYLYTPEFGQAITGPITISEQLLMRPRTVTCIKYNNAGCPN